MGIRAVYDWALRQANKKYASWLLFAIAVIEPCMFPLPPDALMVPMALARQRKKKRKVFKLAAVCTAGSLLGSFLGWCFGALAFAWIGQTLIETYKLQDAFEHFRTQFHQWGMLVIIAKGAVPVIPVPFFLVTLVSGVVHYNVGTLLLSVFIARGGRFFTEAILLHMFGEPIRYFIEHHLPWVAGVIVLGIGLWVWAVVR